MKFEDLKRKFNDLSQKQKYALIFSTVIIIVFGITLFVLSQNSTKTKSVKDTFEDANKNKNQNVTSYTKPDTKDTPQQQLTTAELIDKLSKSIFNDNSILALDNCNKEFSNPNFRDLRFKFNDCEWDINLETYKDTSFSSMYFRIKLTNNKFASESAKIEFSVPTQGEPNGFLCYQNNYNQITSNIHRYSTKASFSYDEQRQVYSSKIVDFNDDKYLEMVKKFLSKSNAVSYPTSYAIDGYKYCKYDGADFATEFTITNSNIEDFRKITESNRSNNQATLVANIYTTSTNTNFIAELDKIVKTLQY